MTDREIFEKWLEEQGIAENDVTARWKGDKLVFLNCSGTGVTAIPELPNLTTLYCYYCPSLTKIEGTNLTKVNCFECPSLTKIEGPKLTGVFCSDCTNLTKIEGPKLTEVYCFECPSLTSTNETRYSEEIGSRDAVTIYYRNYDRIVCGCWICGCWHGTLEKFEAVVNEVYPAGKYHDQYMTFIKNCKNEIKQRRREMTRKEANQLLLEAAIQNDLEKAKLAKANYAETYFCGYQGETVLRSAEHSGHTSGNYEVYNYLKYGISYKGKAMSVRFIVLKGNDIGYYKKGKKCCFNCWQWKNKKCKHVHREDQSKIRPSDICSAFQFAEGRSGKKADNHGEEK